MKHLIILLFLSGCTAASISNALGTFSQRETDVPLLKVDSIRLIDSTFLKNYINIMLHINNSAVGVFLGEAKYKVEAGSSCVSKSNIRYLNINNTVDLRLSKEGGTSTSIDFYSSSFSVKRLY